MFGALLDMYVMTLSMQFQMQSGGGAFSSDDHALAIRVTIEWARHRFPDLQVNHHVPDAVGARGKTSRPTRSSRGSTTGGKRRTPR